MDMYDGNDVFSLLSSTVTSLSVSPYLEDTFISLPKSDAEQNNPNTNAS